MAYASLTMTNPLAAPGTLNPSGSLAETNPLPPYGRPMDGTCDLHPTITGHLAAVKDTWTILLAETVSEGGEWTLTFTPTKMINGLPIGDALAAVTLSVTVGSSHTITDLGDLFVTEYNTKRRITTTAGVTSATRIGEIIGSLTNNAGTLTATSAIAGETFTPTYTAEAGGSATLTHTVDGAGTNIRVGVALARSGTLASDGVTPLVRALTTGDDADDVIGWVADSNTRLLAIDPTAGYSFQYVKPGRDIAIIPVGGGHGQWSAYAEAAVDYNDDVWVRVVAGAGEVAGAANDTPDETAAVYTITPTAAASGVLFHGFVQVYDRDGKVVATSEFYFAADADNTATETVTGLAADLTSSDVDDYLAITGTATLILTMTAGYTANVVSTGAGILTTATTTAYANDHVKIPGLKFSRTTTAAGPCAIQF